MTRRFSLSPVAGTLLLAATLVPLVACLGSQDWNDVNDRAKIAFLEGRHEDHDAPTLELLNQT